MFKTFFSHGFESKSIPSFGSRLRSISVFFAPNYELFLQRVTFRLLFCTCKRRGGVRAVPKFRIVYALQTELNCIFVLYKINESFKIYSRIQYSHCKLACVQEVEFFFTALFAYRVVPFRSNADGSLSIGVDDLPLESDDENSPGVFKHSRSFRNSKYFDASEDELEYDDRQRDSSRRSTRAKGSRRSRFSDTDNERDKGASSSSKRSRHQNSPKRRGQSNSKGSSSYDERKRSSSKQSRRSENSRKSYFSGTDDECDKSAKNGGKSSKHFKSSGRGSDKRKSLSAEETDGYVSSSDRTAITDSSESDSDSISCERNKPLKLSKSPKSSRSDSDHAFTFGANDNEPSSSQNSRNSKSAERSSERARSKRSNAGDGISGIFLDSDGEERKESSYAVEYHSDSEVKVPDEPDRCVVVVHEWIINSKTFDVCRQEGRADGEI